MTIVRNARDQIRSGKSVREGKRAEDNNRRKTGEMGEKYGEEIKPNDEKPRRAGNKKRKPTNSTTTPRKQINGAEN